jgi:hypothetical protein
VDRSQWATFTDVHGSARVPLRQRFRFASDVYEFDVDFHSTVDQYFRAPVSIETDGKARVFSDFRAVGVNSHVVVVHRASNTTRVDRWVSSMNAVEYAYEADLAADSSLREDI